MGEEKEEEKEEKRPVGSHISQAAPSCPSKSWARGVEQGGDYRDNYPTYAPRLCTGPVLSTLHIFSILILQ